MTYCPLQLMVSLYVKYTREDIQFLKGYNRGHNNYIWHVLATQILGHVDRTTLALGLLWRDDDSVGVEACRCRG